MKGENTLIQTFRHPRSGIAVEQEAHNLKRRDLWTRVVDAFSRVDTPVTRMASCFRLR